ncbi:hypothetical protein [Nonomuraea sp. NPDC005650]|uniref:hypothetical protein n=1 Tax=Nonomuraea sp. NPDC005650 TaxID=3157045 RepID=UPI0033AD6423
MTVLPLIGHIVDLVTEGWDPGAITWSALMPVESALAEAVREAMLAMVRTLLIIGPADLDWRFLAAAHVLCPPEQSGREIVTHGSPKIRG